MGSFAVGPIDKLPESFQPYLQAMFDFCKVRDSAEDAEVPLIYAPERAFAQKSSRIILNGEEVELSTIPLPYMALVMTEPVFDPSRYQFARFRKLGYSDDRNQVYSSKYPQPYNLTFQLDIRHRTNLQWYRIFQALHLDRIHHNAAHVMVDLGPFGPIRHRIEVEGPVDNSDLEPGDNRDRVLRKSYTFSLEAWIRDPVYKTPSARTFVLGLKDEVTGETFEEITLDSES